MYSKKYAYKLRCKEKLLTLMMVPFVLFRIIITVFGYLTIGIDYLYSFPWTIYYAFLILALLGSYVVLTKNLRHNYPNEYKDMRSSLLIFFLLELTLYLFWGIFDTLSVLNKIDDNKLFQIDMLSIFIIPYV